MFRHRKWGRVRVPFLSKLRKNDIRKCFCGAKATYVSTTPHGKGFPLFRARCDFHGLTWAFKKEAKVFNTWSESRRSKEQRGIRC